MTTRLLSLGYQLIRFMRLIISLRGLHGVREKLNNDGDRLHREIAHHTAFSQSINQLTEIVSDGLASVNKRSDSGPGA